MAEESLLEPEALKELQKPPWGKDWGGERSRKEAGKEVRSQTMKTCVTANGLISVRKNLRCGMSRFYLHARVPFW